MPTPFRKGGRQHGNHVIASGCSVLRSLRTWHAEKQHAREPGDLLYVLVKRSRPVREGHKPHGGHERTGEVGLCRSTREPAEQRRAAAFGGGRGGKGTDCGEHRSITHASDTEREAHVPGIARCAASSTFSPPLIHSKSRMRKRARTDLRGGRSAMVVPTATVIQMGIVQIGTGKS